MNAVKRPEQDSEEIMIRKAKRKFILGCLLGILSFAVLLAGAILDVQTTQGIVSLFAAFLVCIIAALILLINSWPGLAISDINKIDRKYSKCELTQLYGMKKYDVEQTLLAHKFQYDDGGYYTRKKFSFWKDSICYYIRITDSSTIEKTIRREWNHFNKLEHNGKSVCLILILYTDKLTDADTESLRDIGMLKIADDMVLDMYSSKTMVVVGVDQTTQIGRYLDIGAGHILYLYKHGCRMLKKLFGEAAGNTKA